LTARTQINSFYIYGSFAVAAFFGIAFGSWLIFVITLAVTIGSALQDGKIRPTPTRKGGNPKNRRRGRN
jgi:hypothetical protein